MGRKRILAGCIIGVLFIYIQNVYGTSAQGTHMPKRHQWIWGLEVNFLVDRNLDNDMGGVSGNRFFVTGSYGISPWLSFDGKIGIGNVRWKRVFATQDLDYDTNFAGGYGLRMRLYENKRIGLKTVLGFHHISVHPHSAKDASGDKHQSIIDEWDGSILVSKTMGRFVPYIGGRYGTLDFIKWLNEHDRKRIKSEKDYGLIIGMDYWINKTTKINMEGIFLDGEEIAVGITRDF